MLVNGAEEDPVPPVAELYQFNVPPADVNAVNAVDAEFWHIESGEVTGAVGIEFTCMVAEGVEKEVFWQPDNVTTETKFKVWLEVTPEIVTLPIPLLSKTLVTFDPELIV